MRLSWFALIISLVWLQSSSEIEASEVPYFIKTKNTKIVKLTPKNLELFSVAVFYNTYNNRATITEVDLDIYLDNRYMGRVVNHMSVKVPRRNTFDIPLLFKKEYTLSEIGTLFWRGGKLLAGKKVTIRYVGYIKMRVLGFVPIRIRFEDEVDYYLYE